LPAGRTRRLSARGRPLRAFAAWASLTDSSQDGHAIAASSYLTVKKRKSSSAEKAAATARLRAMVQDVERWPLSEQLLKTIALLEDEAEADPNAAADETSTTFRRPTRT
jgi:hypothetical protein